MSCLASSRVSLSRRSSRLRFSSLASRSAAPARPAPDQGGKGADHVLGQPQGLADLAHRTARAIARHDSGEGRACAPICFVNPLDNFLTQQELPDAQDPLLPCTVSPAASGTLEKK